MHKKIVFFISVIFLTGCNKKLVSVKTQSDPYQEKLYAFESFVIAEMQKNKTPGLTVGFMKDDYLWVKGFGYSDIENTTLMKAESIYRFASVQKSMTAAAILQLTEQGKIQLDNEIQAYVPYFPRKKFPVTVRQLLGHLGGIPHYVNRSEEQHFKDQKTTREAINIFENFDLVAKPGTAYHYSSYGYNLLGAAIEGASGQSYSDYMTNNIWNPAGRTTTRMDNPLDIIANRVRGYQLINDEVKNSEFINISSRFAAGGTRGSVIDLLKFMKALNEGELLSKAGVQLMYHSMITQDGKNTGHGMGWSEFLQKNGLVFINDGGQQETRTFILNFPEKRFSLAVAQNMEKDDDGAIVFRLFELILGEKFVLSKN